MSDEVVSYLLSPKDGLYLDCTFGAGGHSRQLLSKISSQSKLIGLDIDAVAVEIGKKLEQEDDRFSMVRLNFARLSDYQKEHNLPKAKGIIFDLGTSMMQLRDPNRGFSYLEDAHLDMRMDQTSKTTAADILNYGTRMQLKEIFRKYGDIHNSDRLINLISDHRKKYSCIETTLEFRDLIEEAHKKLDPVKLRKEISRTFQAIRIAVNDEIKSFETAMNSLHEVLEVGGIACIITFHSGEEDVLKVWKSKYCDHIEIRDYSKNIVNKFRFVSNGYIVPKAEEISENRSSRSSKLWVFQKVRD
ncbi:S-adenosyl-methyltransferase MraW [Mycoplasma haemocanis str. Illinois]|uniref:Ribosomal RNA small subunit methyltransferase H n=1 Tax=Mycoplasma haemocanis (strain Illinois) TaxID=1111676 RepID=H6N6X0_MYCHN|nr:16S rRNA (cytosine(1402)-N(4))-methyltransferase RsmH [Mycoplasma haemocanis]AEW45392.1 S-adenosyl-methyltransferase MraW [Mycoplasma haemocanis str. Illinois]